ncbi:MAG: tRNA lysidine(34) synthetase TilS [Pseudomonadota bacterium]
MRFDAKFTALIDRFSSDSSLPIALAVSGGSDSIALLNVCVDWARRTRRTLIVYTVDHQLRRESRGEAEHVGAMCQAWQIPHQILTWKRPKATQNAARLARYQLLAEAMNAVGAKVLLTGHTRDDVVETAIIRRRRGVRDANVAGPSLAAPLPIWPSGRGLTLLRPLICTRRAELRESLRAQDIDWVEDPSNLNQSFERVRIREFLRHHPKLHELAITAVTRMQTERTVLDQSVADALRRVTVHPDGLIDTADAPRSVRLLTILARIASGAAKDSRAHSVSALKTSLTKPGARQTLGGSWFQRNGTGFLIGRDPGAPPSDGDRDVFDGRFLIDPKASLPEPASASFLVRHALPPDSEWREIISDRLDHMCACLQTKPLQLTGERA